VASAQEDKLRTINLANVFAVEKVNQAMGEAAAMTEGALAFRSSGSRAPRLTRTPSPCGSTPTSVALR